MSASNQMTKEQLDKMIRLIGKELRLMFKNGGSFRIKQRRDVNSEPDPENPNLCRPFKTGWCRLEVEAEWFDPKESTRYR